MILPMASPKNLPSVDWMLRTAGARSLAAEHGHTLVACEARALLESLRARALADALDFSTLDASALDSALQERVRQRLSSRMRRVLNLTGTVIHTNLGRAQLSDQAIEQLLQLMSGPHNLEYDLAAGRRGDRDSAVEELLCTITGAAAATVVNNNAAAAMLTLAALARGREVLVSRGELIELGGSFRLPDVMLSAGVMLVEVGTTNRTHARDFECAFNERTALVMKVHTSNYAVQGFTSPVDEAELAAIAHSRGVPLASDLGAGSLVDLATHGLVLLRRFNRERVNAAVDVRVAVFVVADERVDHLARLLRRGGVVEVDQRVPVHFPGEDREVFADRANIQSRPRMRFHSLLLSAIRFACALGTRNGYPSFVSSTAASSSRSASSGTLSSTCPRNARTSSASAS